ncbi:MAG: hypothetical protein QM802_10190 [Agriterribacter sp.]
MATSNDFRALYKSISDIELLNILDHPNDYQPLAVKAAEEELLDRKLSDIRINDVRELLIANQQQNEKQKEKVKALEHKIKSTRDTFIDTINPIQSNMPSDEKTIRIIVLVFGGLFLYQFIKDFRTHLMYAKDLLSFPLMSISYLLPQILLPIAILTFWKRRKIGWFLLMVFLTFSAVGTVWALVESFNWKSYDSGNLDRFFPKPSYSAYIIQILFFAGTIIILCKSTLREIFLVDKKEMSLTIGITGLATVFLMLAIP